MKTLQVSNKEKFAILAVFFINTCSSCIAEIMNIGEISSGFPFGLFKGLSGWIVFLFEFVFILILWIIRKTCRVDKVSRIGIILIIAGILSNFVWRVLFGGILKWIDIAAIPIFCLSEFEIMLGLLLTILGVVWHGIE